jgi:two-component system response regulator AtoC
MSIGRQSGKVLVVDDEKNLTLVIRAMLEKLGFTVEAWNDSRKAMERILDPAVELDAVITDLNMPGASGMDVLELCIRERPGTPVILITAFGTVEKAVQALKSGAFDFITKPFDQSEIQAAVSKAVQTARLREEEPVRIWPAADPAGESKPMATPAGFAISSIVGSSPQMQEVFKVLAKIAPSSTTVLVLGESGTGKELVAYEIHRNSPRAKKPFVKINCAAIPATLIESELFGHERGAFTGAVTSKPGRFELAHEGTLFLDEVADMPLEMQVKLLRVLQEQEFERVGGVSPIRVDVRIVTATNKDLEKEVKAGRFREDLYYRLNVLPVNLPPLRERKEDIDTLLRVFIAQFNEKIGRKVEGIEPLCLQALRQYPWPGNIRQLENAVERMVLMSEGAILRVSDLPPEVRATLSDEVVAAAEATSQAGEGSPIPFKEIVKSRTQELERALIEQALEATSGNVTRAAERLGLSRKGLQIKMKELGVQKESGS